MVERWDHARPTSSSTTASDVGVNQVGNSACLEQPVLFYDPS